MEHLIMDRAIRATRNRHAPRVYAQVSRALAIRLHARHELRPLPRLARVPSHLLEIR